MRSVSKRKLGEVLAEAMEDSELAVEKQDHCFIHQNQCSAYIAKVVTAVYEALSEGLSPYYPIAFVDVSIGPAEDPSAETAPEGAEEEVSVDVD